MLGPPNSGKTSLIRDIARLLASKYRTLVIDSNNELAGDGNIPHSCIGDARRMMTPSRAQMGNTMMECVLNHSPEVIVVDELGSRREAQAAVACSRRGVRLIASAHGNLRSLVYNKDLNDVVGGTEEVILSDKTNTGDSLSLQDDLRSGVQKKTRKERTNDPVFPIVVELRRGGPRGEFWVVRDSAEAVDNILRSDENGYKLEKRVRDDETGDLFLTFLSCTSEPPSK